MNSYFIHCHILIQRITHDFCKTHQAQLGKCRPNALVIRSAHARQSYILSSFKWSFSCEILQTRCLDIRMQSEISCNFIDVHDSGMTFLLRIIILLRHFFPFIKHTHGMRFKQVTVVSKHYSSNPWRRLCRRWHCMKCSRDTCRVRPYSSNTMGETENFSEHRAIPENHST